jgi:hypothetical protein
MPSQLPIETVSQFRRAFHRGVKAKRDKRADGHLGSAYDYIAGTSAMLMAREAAFIRDLFRGKYFLDARGQDLTDYVAERYQIPRILDTHGTGTATLVRPNASADAGQAQAFRTIYEGTRILVSGGPASVAVAYAVAADTPVPAGALYVAGLPVRATSYGVGTAVNTLVSGQVATFEDPLWDPSWGVTSVVTQNGTVFEEARIFRARVVALLRQNTVGYAPGIASALAAIGAANVAVFGTNFGGTDLHSSAVYVGDAGFNGTPSLVQQAILRLESCRMLGAEPIVGPMALAALPVTATITLYDDPSKFALDTLATAAINAITNVLGATGSYAYDLDAFFGAVTEVSDAVEDVSFTTPTTSETLLTGSPLFFPQTLTRYQIPTNGINLSFVGPNA